MVWIDAYLTVLLSWSQLANITFVRHIEHVLVRVAAPQNRFGLGSKLTRRQRAANSTTAVARTQPMML